ncbi:MAG: hypothetical protein HQK96_07010 [Nitrospirae bacterium]|nr:hypothetical protein [Nitrospirota bacterium]
MARRVVILGVHRGNDEVDPMDIIQELGRAGRKGIDKKGDGYVLVPKSRTTEMYIKYKQSPPIVSRMIAGSDEGIGNLLFHVVSEVAEGNVSNSHDLVKWHKRSLAAHQGCIISEDDSAEILSTLEKIRAIKKEGSEYVSTGLGKVACLMYMNPYDIFSWYMNFKFVFDNGKFNDTVSLVWAIANCRMFDSGYVATEDQELAMLFSDLCRKSGLEIYNTKAVGGAVLLACIGDARVYADKRKVGLLRMDIERIIQSIKMIDTFYAHWGKERILDRLNVRLRYGIPDCLVELCRLKQIGAVRAETLYGIGIKGKADMIANKEKCLVALGKDDRAEKIYNEAING